MHNPRLSPGAVYDRFVTLRRTVVWSHAVLGALAGVAFVATVTSHGYNFGRSRSGVGLVELAFAPIFPYICSAAYAVPRVKFDRRAVTVFLCALAASTAAGCYWYVALMGKYIGVVGTMVFILSEIVFPEYRPLVLWVRKVH